jgi:NDP-sugar pyrophosphorylase family protein
MKAMLLCAGLGTRLRPLTRFRAKAVMPVLNRPLIVHTLEQLARAGIRDVVINLHHLPDTVKDALRADAPPDIEIRYSYEETILGTAGGIRKAAPFFGGERVVVINGDTLMDFSLEALTAFHEEKGAAATMVLKPPGRLAGYGRVHTDGASKILSVAGRPPLARDSGLTPQHYTGMQIIEPEVLQEIPPGLPWEMNTAVYPALIEKGLPVYGFSTRWDWLDFGSPRDYLDSNLSLLSKPGRLPVSRARRGFMTASDIDGFEKPLDEGDVRIEKQVRLTGGFIAGAGTELQEGAAFHRAVLFEGVRAGTCCTVKNAVIGPGVRIPGKMNVRDCILLETRGALKTFELS